MGRDEFRRTASYLDRTAMGNGQVTTYRIVGVNGYNWVLYCVYVWWCVVCASVCACDNKEKEGR